MSKQNQQYIKALQYTKEQLYMVQQQGLCVSVKHCKALYCEHKYFRGAERTVGQSNLQRFLSRLKVLTYLRLLPCGNGYYSRDAKICILHLHNIPIIMINFALSLSRPLCVVFVCMCVVCVWCAMHVCCPSLSPFNFKCDGHKQRMME